MIVCWVTALASGAPPRDDVGRCPIGPDGPFRNEPGHAHAATRSEAAALAERNARDALLAPFCEPSPGTYWCQLASANAEVTETHAERAGAGWDACTVASISASFVDAIPAERTAFEESVDDLAGAVAVGVPDERRKVSVRWDAEVPAGLPAPWLEVTLAEALGRAEPPVTLVPGDALNGDDLAITLRAADDPAGSYRVSACLGRRDARDCDATLPGLRLPRLAWGPDGRESTPVDLPERRRSPVPVALAVVGLGGVATGAALWGGANASFYRNCPGGFCADTFFDDRIAPQRTSGVAATAAGAALLTTGAVWLLAR